jgi:hypothetical protein
MSRSPHSLRIAALGAVLAVGAGCADSLDITAPTDGQMALGVSANAITVQSLPTIGTRSVPSSVTESGIIFGRANMTSSSPSTPIVWHPPHESAPEVLPVADPARSSFIGFISTPNRLDDAVGEDGFTAGWWKRENGSTPGWIFHPLDLGGYTYLVMSGINDAREIVGTLRAEKLIGAYWSSPDAQPERLPEPAGLPGPVTATRANDINNQSMIVGYVQYEVVNKRQVTTYSRGVIWRGGPGEWTAHLLPANSSNDRVFDSNDNGWIAGISGSSQALVWTPDANGAYTQSPTVLASQQMLTTIDHCNRVVGATSGKGAKPWIWSNGTLTYLPVPSGLSEGQARHIATPEVGPGFVVGEGQPKGNAAPVPLLWRIPGCP